MKDEKSIERRAPMRFFRLMIVSIILPFLVQAQSLNIPTTHYGLSLGNSQKFTGVRINWSDRNVEQVTGLNLTLWRAKNNEQAVVRGISLGMVMPEAGQLYGAQVGLVGVIGGLQQMNSKTATNKHRKNKNNRTFL